VFAGLALALAAVGMYGVTSFAVQQQTREMAVRLAVGARRADISWLVIRSGLRQALIGLALGLVVASVLGRELAALLYGVAPIDVTTSLAASVGFAAIACLANVAPAWRAARVDPVRVLQGS